MKKNKNSVIDKINQSQSITIGIHQSPDGDAVGSMVALALGLIAMGKKVSLLPNKIPQSLEIIKNLLPQSIYDQEVPKGALLIALDSGELKRVEGYIPDYFECMINIDHHGVAEDFGDINWVLPDKAATAELIYELLIDLKVTITKDMAMALYAGIIGDTGSFRHSNAKPETLRLAAELRMFDFDHAYVTRKTLDEMTPTKVLLLGHVLSHFKIKNHIAISHVTQSFQMDNGIIDEDFDNVINFLLNVKGNFAACLLREQEDGTVRGNLRSTSDDLNVAQLAKTLGGGGHKRAAGFTLHVPLDESVKQLENLLW